MTSRRSERKASTITAHRLLGSRWQRMLAAIAVLIIYSILHNQLTSRTTSSLGRQHPVVGRSVRPTSFGYRIKTAGCTVPQFNPFDSTIKDYLHRFPNGSWCQGKPNFLQIRNGFTVILEDKLEEHGVRPEDLRCYYKEIRRNNTAANPETVFALGERKPLLFNKPLKEEFVFVKCRVKQSKNRIFHRQFLLNPVVKKGVEKRCRNANGTTPHKMRVLVLGLDSVSYLNVDRHLPDTTQFVRETLGAFELRGYNKVDDNTYPNLHALLTGLNFTEALKYRLQGFYDTLTSHLIWQQYRKRGYRTMFLEDWPWFGTFHRFAKGFRRPPADYYSRHAIIAMEAWSKSITKEGMKARCYGPTMVFEEMLDYVARFADLMGERPFFTFAWMNEVTHDSVNSAGYADRFFLRHLESLHSCGALNHTLLIFCSDHGMHFGDLRLSYIGKFENRQPFAFVVFPQWFLEQNPKAARSLRVNQFRLTTPFDLHATLVELLDYPSVERPQTTYGRSLLHNIPEARTCDDAHIRPNWCACNPRGDVVVTDTLAWSMADQLVSRINLLVARETRKCAQFKLIRVMDVMAFQVTPTRREHNSSHYWVTAEVSPGNIIFEGTVYLIGDNLTVLDEFTRLNYAPSMNLCVEDHFLGKSCVCV